MCALFKHMGASFKHMSALFKFGAYTINYGANSKVACLSVAYVSNATGC
jgi:hypothetical protein